MEIVFGGYASGVGVWWWEEASGGREEREEAMLLEVQRAV